MRAKTIPALVAATAVVAVTAAATVAVSQSAGAAVAYYYYGYAGGSSIKALDNTVTSQLSAESSVLSRDPGAADTNHLAALKAQGVLTLGAINTSAQLKRVTGGQQVVAIARAADVSLLGGLITAKAITTVTTTSRINGVSSSTTHSDFVGLKIIGIDLPANIPENYTVRVGDVAAVGINAGLVGNNGDYSAGIGAGLRVTLLKPEGNSDTGAEIDVNPTYTIVAPDSSPDTGHSTIGGAFATYITAQAGKTLAVRSDPTAPTTVFAQGTGGKVKTTSLAAVNLGPVGKIGAVKTTGVGTNDGKVANVTTTSAVGDVNLLGGIIKAQAISVRASASLTSASGSMKLLDLTIAGKRIPLSVKKNTVLNLGIGKITINQQIRSGTSITVRGVDIVLGKAAYGLPAGAEIQLASAYAQAS